MILRLSLSTLLGSLAFIPSLLRADAPDEMDVATAKMLAAASHPPDGAKDDGAGLPAGPVATGPVDLRIDWNHTTFTTGRDAYSLNAFQSFNPAIPADPRYQENIAYINPGALRYHASSLVSDSRTSAKGWLNHETRAWDVEKIRQATAHWPKGPSVLLTIPSWPSWMREGEEKLLAGDQYDAYAALCADLVRILNVDLGLGVKRWEPMNERELAYVRALERNGKPPQYGKLIAIYNRCAAAMKRVDPTIQVGGPAISSAAWLDLVQRFAKGAGNRLDFFSCHLYGGNDAAASDGQIFDAAVGFGPTIRRAAEVLRREIPGRHIDILLDEFNISWTYKTNDRRMQNHKGAVFDALAMIAALSHGAAATFAWNDVDGIYGKMSQRYELRPSAHLYHLLNAHFVGAVAATASSDEKRVVPFAVRDARTGDRALMLINRSDAPQIVHLVSTGAPAVSAYSRHEISAAGYTVTPLDAKTLAAGLTLPDCSVTVLLPASDHQPVPPPPEVAAPRKT